MRVVGEVAGPGGRELSLQRGTIEGVQRYRGAQDVAQLVGELQVVAAVLAALRPRQAVVDARAKGVLAGQARVDRRPAQLTARRTLRPTPPGPRFLPVPAQMCVTGPLMR